MKARQPSILSSIDNALVASDMLRNQLKVEKMLESCCAAFCCRLQANGGCAYCRREKRKVIIWMRHYCADDDSDDRSIETTIEEVEIFTSDADEDTHSLRYVLPFRPPEVMRVYPNDFADNIIWDPALFAEYAGLDQSHPEFKDLWEDYQKSDSSFMNWLSYNIVLPKGEMQI